MSTAKTEELENLKSEKLELSRRLAESEHEKCALEEKTRSAEGEVRALSVHLSNNNAEIKRLEQVYFFSRRLLFFFFFFYRALNME